jgi:hypothetical protein
MRSLDSSRRLVSFGKFDKGDHSLKKEGNGVYAFILSGKVLMVKN